MPRADVFLATGPSSGAVFRVKMGATKDGRLTAAQAELFYEAGAYPGSPVGSSTLNFFRAQREFESKTDAAIIPSYLQFTCHSAKLGT